MAVNRQILETATFAGGCFWCTEAIFKRLKGVTSVTSGYTGGYIDNPTYDNVSTGETGHTEAVQISYDPKIISYDTLLEVFWASHDPTTLNRQGADLGTQYRSTIFYHNPGQKVKAEKSKRALEQSGKLDSKIVTTIKPLHHFYRAEEYHHNYYEDNKEINPYCSIVISPKIQKLLTEFNQQVKDEFKV